MTPDDAIAYIESKEVCVDLLEEAAEALVKEVRRLEGKLQGTLKVLEVVERGRDEKYVRGFVDGYEQHGIERGYSPIVHEEERRLLAIQARRMAERATRDRPAPPPSSASPPE
jgi:hypothetical protein